MALTPIETLRLTIGDKPRLQREAFDGDGVTTEYRLKFAPVQVLPAPQVWKDGTLLTEVTDYLIEYELGLIAMTIAPAANAELIIQYMSVVWSDEEMQEYLDAADGVNLLAGHNMLYAWAARLAVEAIKESRSGGGGMGAVTIDTSVRAREMRATADALLRQYEKYESSGLVGEGITEVAWTGQMYDRVAWNEFLDDIS